MAFWSAVETHSVHRNVGHLLWGNLHLQHRKKQQRNNERIKRWERKWQHEGTQIWRHYFQYSVKKKYKHQTKTPHLHTKQLLSRKSQETWNIQRHRFQDKNKTPLNSTNELQQHYTQSLESQHTKSKQPKIANLYSTEPHIQHGLGRRQQVRTNGRNINWNTSNFMTSNHKCIIKNKAQTFDDYYHS